MPCKVRKFEEDVWKLDSVRIVICTASADTVEPYDFEKAADQNWTVAEFIEKRVATLVGRDKDIVAITLDGARAPHNTKLKNLKWTTVR